MKKHINVPIFIPHLGCPNDCVFCNQRTISGHGDYDFAAVKGELDRAFATVDARVPIQIAYFGGSFTGIGRPEMIRLLTLANEYIDAGKCESIRVSTRPDYIDEEILNLLKRYRVRTIELGIQSMDDGVLAASCRGHTAADTRRACGLIRQYGFELVGQMMIGLPGSDETSETETARAICDMGAMGARIYPTVVFRGTALAGMAASGEYAPLVEETAVGRTAAALSVFIARGIPVIRIGLQSGEMEGDIVSGGYHPAIGELAYGRYFRDAMERELAGRVAAGRHVTVMTVPADLSKAVGQHGMNRTYLTEKFALGGMKFVASAEISPHSFRMRISDS